MGNSSSEEKASKPKFFDGVKAEFKKITWPDRDLLLRQSVAVVGVSIVPVSYTHLDVYKRQHGTGLGLYISDAVVKGKFGGNMWVEDNPEGGAIVGVSIPLSEVQEEKTGKNKGD